MVRVLDRKLARELWRMRGQVLAIAVVLAAAVATFVLSLGVYRSLVETRDAYYARNGFAEVFVTMTRAPGSVTRRIAAIPGVERVEGTIQQYATLELPRRDMVVRALITSVDEHETTRLNRVTLRLGRMPSPGEPGEVVIDEAFANANALRPGSTFDALIYGTRQSLVVVGVGLSPDHIYSIAPGDLIPDSERFGILWMGRRALEAATDRTEAINAVALTLSRGAVRADVIRQVDRILEPYGGTGAYGREDHISHAFLDNELTQLDAMTRVIPPVFLLVSTFLVYIVLGRIIRTERTQIGLLKAFGYTNREIGWHYLKFALTVALLATVLGYAAGVWMGRSMTRLYAEYFQFPFLRYSIAADVFLAAGGLSLASAALGAFGGVRSAAGLAPAVAMSPPPPPIYRSGTAERLGQWAGLSAVGQMIIRHIARWPGRSAITVTGIALSLGLLFSTMQFMDASRTMLDSFFFRAQRQDLTVTFIEPRNHSALLELAQIPGVLRAEATRAIPVVMANANRQERTAIESTEPGSRLTAHIDQSGAEIPMPVAGLMLSRQLADQLQVRAGEDVHVTMLGGRRTSLTMPVARIVDEFVGARAYASPETVDRLAGDAAPAGSALLRVDPAKRGDVLIRLKDMPGVLSVTERDAALRKFEAMIDDNIFTMMFFYIGFASAIAVGVVYNSARILFSEREHELATLRVLGYHRREVAMILIGEVALLVIISIPVGCLTGYWLGQLMTAMFSSDLFRLPFAPNRATYGYASLIVSLAAIATVAIVARRVGRLDMIAVLKAREA